MDSLRPTVFDPENLSSISAGEQERRKKIGKASKQLWAVEYSDPAERARRLQPMLTARHPPGANKNEMSREDLLARQHIYNQNRHRKIAAAELQQLQQDLEVRFRCMRPAIGQTFTLLEGTTITDFDIICLECGAILKMLGNHLPVHEMTGDRFREKWGLSRSTPLCSARLSSKISQIVERSGLQPPADRRFGAKLGPSPGPHPKPLRKQASFKLGAAWRGRSRPDRWAWATDREIAELAIKGMSPTKIARKLGPNVAAHSAVSMRLKRMNFPSLKAGPYRMWRGEPHSSRHLLETLSDYGITRAELARLMGVRQANMYHRLNHGTPGVPLSLSWSVKLEKARKLLAKRPDPLRPRGGRPAKLTPSEIKDAREKYRSLKGQLGEFWRFIRSDRSSASVANCWIWLCDHARKGGTLLRWPGLLRWLPKIVQELKQNRAEQPGQIALNIVATEFLVSRRTLDTILFSTK